MGTLAQTSLELLYRGKSLETDGISPFVFDFPK
jgi:hypothetical protein